MWYLLTQYWLWLLLALVLGLLIGWITCGGEKRGWGWLPLGLIVAAVAALAAVLRLVNGVPALWIETGVLLFASYLIGCCLGCWLKRMLAEEPQPAVAQPVMAAPKQHPRPRLLRRRRPRRHRLRSPRPSP